MGAYRLSMFLKEEGTTAYWAAFPRLLDREANRELLAQIEVNYFDSLYEETDSLKTLLRLLRPKEEAGHLAWCCLELAVLYYMNPQIGEVFAAIHPSSRQGATVSLAAKLLFGEAAVLEDFSLLQEAFQRCELLLQAEYPVKRLGDALLSADDRLIQWIEDESTQFQHPFVQKGELALGEECPIWEDKQQELLRELKGSALAVPTEITVAAISGETGSGR